MPLDLKKMRENYEKKNEARSDRWKPASPGTTPIRVLPHTLRYLTDNIAEIAFTYYMHYNVGPEGSKSAVVCPKTLNWKNVCPICEAVALLQKTGDPADASMAGDMRRAKRNLLNILDLTSAETIAKGVQAYECGPKVYEEIAKWINEKWGDPISLDNGRNFTLTVAIPGGDKMKTQYSIEPDPSQSSIVSLLPANFKEQIKKLETMIPKVQTYEELKRALEGQVDYAGGEGPKPTAAPAYVPQPAAPAVQAPGASAADAVKAASAASVSVQPASPDVPPAPATPMPVGAKPNCYGQLYSTKAERCVACGVNVECKKAFLQE